jgi:FKBP-type peptidyl-prolyl cis-trans isomerase FkpA
MFNKPRVLLAVACASLVVACTKPATGGADASKPADAKSADTTPVPADLSSDAQKLSYSIGYDMGHQMSNGPIKDYIDVKALEKGIEEAYAGKDARLTEQQRREIQTTVRTALQQKMLAERQAKAKDNEAAGEAFLADNAKKAGIKTTASGLQYEVLTEGKGAHPTAKDNVTVNYKGTTIDGKQFDSSYDRGQPAKFLLGNVIPGWTEGVQLMTPGSKYKFYIPAKLAYGENAPPNIGPNQVLIFEVELISIDPPTAAPAAKPVPGAPAASNGKSK